MEICKTGAEKSSPGLFKIYVLSAGYDINTDAERAITCRCKFKAPLIQSKCTKNEGQSENMVLNGKTM